MPDLPTRRSRAAEVPDLSGVTHTMADAPVPTEAPGGTKRHSGSSGDDDPTQLAVPEVPGYELLGELGRGGIGVVYKARQHALNRIVALKLVRASEIRPREQTRFQAEAEAAAALQHPNVAQIYETSRYDGKPYIALEFCGGGNLSGRIRQDLLAPRPAAETVAILARAVQAAHDHGILHRDLKPDNILLTSDGVLKVTDFGLAKRFDPGSGMATPGITHAGTILGTPSYMAPEQTEGEANRLSDVYSLGAILYECLTGRPPFRGASTIDTMLAVTSEEPVAPSKLVKVPNELEAICLKCLEKKPEKRYSSAALLAEDLQRFLDGRPTLAQPLSNWQRLLKWSRRRPALAGLIGTGVISLLLLSGLSVGLFRAYRKVDRERENAKNSLSIALTAVDDILEQEDLPGAGDPEVQRQAMLDSVSKSLDRLGQYSGDNPELLTRGAKAYLRRGRLLVDTGKLDEAVAEYGKGVAVCREQLAKKQDSLVWRRELGTALNRLGGTYHRAAKVAEATTAYQEAEDVRRKLVDDTVGADDEHDLAVTLTNRAGLDSDQPGRQTEAIQRFAEAAEVLQPLVKNHPDAPRFQNALAQNRFNLGRFLVHLQGRSDDAIKEVDAARALWQRLCDTNPLSTLYQTKLATATTELAVQYQRRKDAGAAQAFSAAALASWREVVKRHPKVTTFQGLLGISAANLGQIDSPNNPIEARIGSLEEAVLALTAAQNLPEYRPGLANAYLALARAYGVLKSDEQSRNAFDQAVARYAELTRQFPKNKEYSERLAAARRERAKLPGGDL